MNLKIFNNFDQNQKMEITLKDIESNLKTLPENMYQEVNDFLDFLKYKSHNKSGKDWSEDLSDHQRKSINRGFEDVEKERIYSHEEAKERIKKYLLEKSK